MNPRQVTTQFPEWLDVRHHDPVRQGDILARLDNGDDIWRDLLVVLTADCDLARSKHDGALSCVPSLPYAEYLLRFKYEKVRDSLTQNLARRLLEVHARECQAGKDLPNISASRMRDWLSETDVSVVIEALQLTGQGESDFRRLAQVLSGLAKATPNSLSTAIDGLAAAKFALGGAKTLDKARSAVAADFASSLKTLPGDALFLNELSPQHISGYVTYLRRVIEVDESTVARSASRLPHDAKYLRLTRLRSPYIFALSQQFGSVFSAIGLPVEYETARDTTIELLKELEA